MACQLLGFKSSELQKLTLDDFVLDPEHGRGIEAMAETEIFQKLQPEGVSNFRQNDPDATTMNGKVLISGKVVSVLQMFTVICRKMHCGDGNIPKTSTGSFKLPPK